MISTARKIIDDDYIAIMDGMYGDPSTKVRCKNYFNKLCKEGKILSSYEDSVWKTDNEVNPCGISFSLNEEEYMSHGMKYTAMSYQKIVDAMKIYAIWCMGEYSFNGIQYRVRLIKKVLEQVGEKGFVIEKESSFCLKEFFQFIKISPETLNVMLERIKLVASGARGRRKLKPIINYAVTAEKSKELMLYGIEEEKLKFFPVYLILNLSSAFPLRATEWTVTPYNCLQKTENGYTITIRRTNMKKGERKIGNDVDSDYKLYEYSIPYTDDVRLLEWYIEKTKGHRRRFLFDYNENSIRDSLRKRFSLESLNELIKEFVETYLNDSDEFKWLRGIYEIDRFEPFTAGDMRPLGLINLYFSGAPLDICMELADHDNMETTYHYIGNIKEVIEASQFMRMQERINRERKEIEHEEKKEIVEQKYLKPGCNSNKPGRGDVSDCDLRCLDSESCVVCKYCNPTEDMKREFIEEKKSHLNEMLADMQDFIKVNQSETFDKKLIQFQKAAEGYRDACEIKAKSEYEKWKAMKEEVWNGVQRR